MSTNGVTIHRRFRLLRALGAVAIVIVTGLVSASLVFSDLGPGESLALRITLGVALAFLAGLAFGRLEPSVWYLGFLASWGALTVGTVVFLTQVVGRGSWATLRFASSCLVLPLLSLLGSFVGARGRRIPSNREAG